MRTGKITIGGKDYITCLSTRVLVALEERPLLADDLVERTQIPARRVLSALTLLQVQGYVAEQPGRRFKALARVKIPEVHSGRKSSV